MRRLVLTAMVHIYILIYIYGRVAGAAPQQTVQGRAPRIRQHHSNADPNTVAVGAVSLREGDGRMEGEVKAKKKRAT